MPEAGNGDVGLFQALPRPHSPKLVPYSPTGDSHWATDTTDGRISREVMGRDSSNKTVRVRTLPQRTRLRRGFLPSIKKKKKPGDGLYSKREAWFLPWLE